MQPQSFQPKEGNRNPSFRSRNNLRSLTTKIDRNFLKSMQPITDYDNDKEDENYLESTATLAKFDNSKFRFSSFHNLNNNFFQKNEKKPLSLPSPIHNEDAKDEKLSKFENSPNKELASPSFLAHKNEHSAFQIENEEMNNDNLVQIDSLLIPEDDINKKPGIRYKMNFSNAVGSDLAGFFKLTAWTSLEKFLILLPLSHPFHVLKDDLKDRESAWREFLFKSVKEYYADGMIIIIHISIYLKSLGLKAVEKYPNLSSIFSNKYSSIQLLALIKYFRSDVLEILAKNFAHENLGEFLQNKEYHGLETVCKITRINKPILVFYENMYTHFLTLIEMKSYRLNNKKGLIRIVKGFCLDELKIKLKAALKERKWIYIDFDYDTCIEITSFLKEILHTIVQSLNETKIFIFLKTTDNKNIPETKNISMQLLFNFSYRIFLNHPNSIKMHMQNNYWMEIETVLYMNEKRKQPFTQSKPIIEVTQFSEYLNIRSRHIKSNTNNFVNLNNFVDIEELRKKNTNYLSIIDSSSKKLWYAIMFCISVFMQREGIVENIEASSNRFKHNIDNLLQNSNEYKKLLFEQFDFLETFAVQPFDFLEKINSFFICGTYGPWNAEEDGLIFQSFLRDYLTVQHEKQLILTIRNSKYEFYKFNRGATHEENVNKIIQNIPDTDFIEIFGLGKNSEFIYDYNRSHNFMNFMRKFDDAVARTLDKEDQFIKNQIPTEINIHFKKALQQYQTFITSFKKYNSDVFLSETNVLIETLMKAVSFIPHIRETLDPLFNFIQSLYMNQNKVNKLNLKKLLLDTNEEKTIISNKKKNSKIEKKNSSLFEPEKKEKGNFYEKFDLDNKKLPITQNGQSQAGGVNLEIGHHQWNETKKTHDGNILNNHVNKFKIKATHFFNISLSKHSFSMSLY